ncbi:hypothetical protein BK666_09585 [Pseudomonas frederiksbergensis]|uniref:DUF3817 domain-containing protein n=1 Tax=Pseudomonas frederiksbergensis TaxID=104087 RepID=A0A423K7Z9_9PSED|nr:DUF3817 domain-containing protein [Pseudomonas frederiksbergensis]RON47924.1 hypothetical protein BK666_09585 [Pseudomonas frederiksbergensis]
MTNDLTSRSLGTLRQLRYAAILEGSTLALLLGVAVPLKHVFDWPAAVQVIGPLHGLVFLLYGWLVTTAAAGEKWKRSDLARALGSALIPLGGFFAARYFRQQEKQLHGQNAPVEQPMQ